MVKWEASFVRDLVRTRLARLAPLGRADLSADFAFHYPISVMSAAAGLPVEHVDTFYDQATKLTNVAIDDADRLAASRDMEVMVGRCSPPAGPSRGTTSSASSPPPSSVSPTAPSSS